MLNLFSSTRKGGKRDPAASKYRQPKAEQVRRVLSLVESHARQLGADGPPALRDAVDLAVRQLEGAPGRPCAFHTLDLSRAGLRDEQAIAIARALEEVPIVAELDLRDNELTERGVEAVAHMLWRQLTLALPAEAARAGVEPPAGAFAAGDWAALRASGRRFVRSVRLDGNPGARGGGRAACETVRQFTELLAREDARAELRCLFGTIDADGSGTLSGAELERAWGDMCESCGAGKRPGAKAARRQARRVLERCDADNDGFVSFAEIEDYVMPDAGPGGLAAARRSAIALLGQEPGAGAAPQASLPADCYEVVLVGARLGLGLAGARPTRVAEVIVGGAAHSAGLHVGTEVLMVGQHDVRDKQPEEIGRVIRDCGRPLRLTLRHDRAPVPEGAKPAAPERQAPRAPAVRSAPSPSPARVPAQGDEGEATKDVQFVVKFEGDGRLGMKFGPPRGGVLTVASVSGKAEALGVRRGDRILAVNERVLERYCLHSEVQKMISSTSRPFDITFERTVLADDGAGARGARAAAAAVRESRPGAEHAADNAGARDGVEGQPEAVQHEAWAPRDVDASGNGAPGRRPDEGNEDESQQGGGSDAEGEEEGEEKSEHQKDESAAAGGSEGDIGGSGDVERNAPQPSAAAAEVSAGESSDSDDLERAEGREQRRTSHGTVETEESDDGSLVEVEEESEDDERGAGEGPTTAADYTSTEEEDDGEKAVALREARAAIQRAAAAREEEGPTAYSEAQDVVRDLVVDQSLRANSLNATSLCNVFQDKIQRHGVRLQVLDISGCDLGDVGLGVILVAAENGTLTSSLDLSYNSIRVIRDIGHMRSLEKLSLGYNNIGPSAVSLRPLSTNRNLHNLSLVGNPIVEAQPRLRAQITHFDDSAEREQSGSVVSFSLKPEVSPATEAVCADAEEGDDRRSVISVGSIASSLWSTEAVGSTVGATVAAAHSAAQSVASASSQQGDDDDHHQSAQIDARKDEAPALRSADVLASDDSTAEGGAGPLPDYEVSFGPGGLGLVLEETEGGRRVMVKNVFRRDSVHSTMSADESSSSSEESGTDEEEGRRQEQAQQPPAPAQHQRQHEENEEEDAHDEESSDDEHATTDADYEVSFGPGGLGLVLEETEGGRRVIVKQLVQGGRAAQGGVQIGDEVVALNGRSTAGQGFEGTLRMLKAASRPMSIGFRNSGRQVPAQVAEPKSEPPPPPPSSASGGVVAIDWIVDCYDRQNDDWVIGSASQFVPASAQSPPQLRIRIEADDGEEQFDGLLALSPTYAGLRLVEVRQQVLGRCISATA
eukprot:g1368.t1